MKLDCIDELAQSAEARWREVNYSEDAFPDIATKVFEEVGAHRRLTTSRVLQAVLAPWASPRSQIRHPSSGIVTLYTGTRFQILGHLWVDSVGSAHQHGWVGAYQMVDGSSLSAHFEFEEHHRLRSEIRLGQLRTTHLSYLRSGDIVPVHAGHRLIHSLSHVERPSLSISLRSVDRTASTLDYARPGICYPMGSMERDIEDRLRCLDVLLQTDEAAWEEALGTLVQEHNIVTTFYALRQASLNRRLIPERVLEMARRQHGPLFDYMERSLGSFLLTSKIEGLRRTIQDHDLRFFLGVLYLAENRGEVLQLFALRHGDEDPTRWLGSCLAKLLIDTGDGDAGDGDSGDGDDDDMEMPEGVVEGLGRLAMGQSLDAILPDLAKVADPEDVEDEADFLREAIGALEEAVMYRPLFAG